MPLREGGRSRSGMFRRKKTAAHNENATAAAGKDGASMKKESKKCTKEGGDADGRREIMSPAGSAPGEQDKAALVAAWMFQRMDAAGPVAIAAANCVSAAFSTYVQPCMGTILLDGNSASKVDPVTIAVLDVFLGLMLLFLSGEYILCIAAAEAFRLGGWDTSMKTALKQLVRVLSLVPCASCRSTKRSPGDVRCSLNGASSRRRYSNASASVFAFVVLFLARHCGNVGSLV